MKEDYEAHAQAQLASLKRDMRKTMEDATVRAMHKVMAEFEAKSDQRLMEMPEKQDEFVAPGGGYVPAIPLPQPPTWHHPDCEGECIACLIEREVTAAYGTQGLAYLRRHLAVTQPPEDALWHRIAELEGALAGLQTQLNPLSGYINRAGINANDSPITVVEKLERAIEASNQETQRKPLTSQERDAQRWRFLMENSYDSKSVTQFHVWEHSWEPHSQTGEPTEWKQRVRGIALIDFIDRAIEAKLKEKNA